MLAIDHALSGALIAGGLCVGLHTQLDIAAVATVATAGAACLPDIDHPDTAISSTFGSVSRTLSRSVSHVTGGHRHGTHTLLAVVVVTVILTAIIVIAPLAAAVVCGILASIAWRCAAPLPVRVLPLVYIFGTAAGILVALHPVGVVLPLAIAGGWCIHLAGDVVTGSGVPVLLPLSSRKISLPVLGQVNGTREHIARVVLIVALAITTWAGVHNAVSRVTEHLAPASRPAAVERSI